MTPIGAVGALGAVVPTAPTAPTGTAVAGAAQGGFAGLLDNVLGQVQGAQHKADGLAVKAATGDLTNVQDYMVAAQQANIDTQLTVAVRNNAVQAFQQIMGMQL